MCVPVQGLVVLGAVERCRLASHSPLMLKLSLPHWPSGTTSAMTQRASIQLISLLAAVRWCTGSAQAVQEGSHTAGEPSHLPGKDKAAGVQFVLASKHVSVILWRLCFHLWQLSLMWTRTALHLLREQLRPAKRCGGGMQNLAVGDKLCISALDGMFLALFW